MTAKRARKTKHENAITNSEVVNINRHTRPKKKDATLIPRNLKQEELIVQLNNPDKDIVFAVGPAGTGKTLISITAAIKAFKEGRCQKIVITRPAVGNDEELGFLPGSLLEKMDPWTRPIFDVFEEYYTKPQIKDLLEYGDLEVAPLGYMRGRTFKNAWVIGDEMQNSTPSQMKMFLTRIGYGSKMVVTGDPDQHDRKFNDNGLIEIVEKVRTSQPAPMSLTEFTSREIERHQTVKDVLSLYN